MSTKYYLSEQAPCMTCGHFSAKKLFIGQASKGWCFLLNTSEEGLQTLGDWFSAIDAGIVCDEYGKVIPTIEMMRVILVGTPGPSWDSPNRWFWYRSEQHFHSMNSSARGPDNLLASRLHPAPTERFQYAPLGALNGDCNGTN